MRLLPESHTYALPGSTDRSTTTPPGLKTLCGTTSLGDISEKSGLPRMISAHKSPDSPRTAGPGGNSADGGNDAGGGRSAPHAIASVAMANAGDQSDTGVWEAVGDPDESGDVVRVRQLVRDPGDVHPDLRRASPLGLRSNVEGRAPLANDPKVQEAVGFRAEVLAGYRQQPLPPARGVPQNTVRLPRVHRLNNRRLLLGLRAFRAPRQATATPSRWP